jgi:hypothetical protein
MKENKKKNNNCGFGKILLGIGLAAVGMLAYKKIPAVKNGCDTVWNAGRNLVGKAGEALSKAGKNNEPATPSKENSGQK